jgi:hypothetical protein
MRPVVAPLALVAVAAFLGCGGSSGVADGGTTTPNVAFTSPWAGAGGVFTNASVVVTFSQAMDCTSITSSSFSLSNRGIPVLASISCNGATATLTPSAGLSKRTLYVGTVQPSVTDTLGQSLTGPYSWSFLTL